MSASGPMPSASGRDGLRPRSPRLRRTRSPGPRPTKTRPGARASAPGFPSRRGTSVRRRASTRRSRPVAAGAGVDNGFHPVHVDDVSEVLASPLDSLGGEGEGRGGPAGIGRVLEPTVGSGLRMTCPREGPLFVLLVGWKLALRLPRPDPDVDVYRNQWRNVSTPRVAPNGRWWVSRRSKGPRAVTGIEGAIPVGLDRAASAWMTIGALSLFPLALLYCYFLFSGLTGGYCDLICSYGFIAGLCTTVALAVVAPVGGLVLQTHVDKLRKAYGFPVRLMALRSTGCAFALLLALVSLAILIML